MSDDGKKDETRRAGRRGGSPADEKLWRAATAGVTPLPAGKTPAPPPPRPERKSPGNQKRTGPLPPPETGARRPAAPSTDRRTAEKLRGGKLRPEARLDLHGMTRDEAFDALSAFIAGSRNRGRRVVLVITGKGRSREAEGPWYEPVPGLLRDHVPVWLRSPPLNSLVLDAVPARPGDGGEGALYVLLKKRRPG